MTFLARFRLGKGKLDPKLQAALRAEGLVLIEEGLHGSIRYRHFKGPGRRHHGKVTLERFGLAISEERFVVYCRSGSTKLIDTPFSDPRLSMMDLYLGGHNTVSIRIDYDRGGVPNVSGEITISVTTPNAPTIVEQLRVRVGR